MLACYFWVWVGKQRFKCKLLWNKSSKREHPSFNSSVISAAICCPTISTQWFLLIAAYNSQHPRTQILAWHDCSDCTSCELYSARCYEYWCLCGICHVASSPLQQTGFTDHSMRWHDFVLFSNISQVKRMLKRCRWHSHTFRQTKKQGITAQQVLFFIQPKHAHSEYGLQQFNHNTQSNCNSVDTE